MNDFLLNNFNVFDVVRSTSKRYLVSIIHRFPHFFFFPPPVYNFETDKFRLTSGAKFFLFLYNPASSDLESSLMHNVSHLYYIPRVSCSSRVNKKSLGVLSPGN